MLVVAIILRDIRASPIKLMKLSNILRKLHGATLRYDLGAEIALLRIFIRHLGLPRYTNVHSQSTAKLV